MHNYDAGPMTYRRTMYDPFEYENEPTPQTPKAPDAPAPDAPAGDTSPPTDTSPPGNAPGPDGAGATPVVRTADGYRLRVPWRVLRRLLASFGGQGEPPTDAMGGEPPGDAMGGGGEPWSGTGGVPYGPGRPWDRPGRPWQQPGRPWYRGGRPWSRPGGFRAGWKPAGMRRIAQLARRARRIGTLRHRVTGRRLPVFRARSGGRNYRMVARRRGQRLELEFIGPEELGMMEMETEMESTRKLDPGLVALTERIMAREVDLEQPGSTSWTTCFTAADVTKVEKAYKDNAKVKPADRCSCIVMLNVALGQLLPLTLKQNRARGTSNRTVQMAALTTETIEQAMKQLEKQGFALPATVMDFVDKRNKRAGTLKPEKLKASVRDEVLKLADKKGCWFAFAMSVMDGYHSVLLLVDRTGASPRIYWLDQHSTGVNNDVTSTLDQKLTSKTQEWWQDVMNTKNKGYDTTIRLWPLRK